MAHGHTQQSSFFLFFFQNTINESCECGRIWQDGKHTHARTQAAMSSLCAHLPVQNNAPDEAQGQLVVSIHYVRPADVYQINLKLWQIGRGSHDVNIQWYRQKAKLYQWTLTSVFAITAEQLVFNFIQAARRIPRHFLRCRHQRRALLKMKRSRARNDCRQRLRRRETEHEVKRQVLRISCEASPAPNYLSVASLSQSPMFTHRHLGGSGGTCTRLSVREGIFSVAAQREFLKTLGWGSERH